MAEMDMATAIKRAKSHLCPEFTKYLSGRYRAKINPSAKGIAIPIRLVENTTRRSCLRVARFTSVPATKSRKMLPSQARVPSIWVWAEGNRDNASSGASAPKMDGPNKTPAKISPTTAACPSLRKKLPNVSAADKSRKSWKRRRAKSCSDGNVIVASQFDRESRPLHRR